MPSTIATTGSATASSVNLRDMLAAGRGWLQTFRQLPGLAPPQPPDEECQQPAGDEPHARAEQRAEDLEVDRQHAQRDQGGEQVEDAHLAELDGRPGEERQPDDLEDRADDVRARAFEPSAGDER